MARQLTLLEAPPTWRLDDVTRETGRRGVAEARATLRAALAATTAPERATPGTRGAAARGNHSPQRRSAA